MHLFAVSCSCLVSLFSLAMCTCGETRALSGNAGYLADRCTEKCMNCMWCCSSFVDRPRSIAWFRRIMSALSHSVSLVLGCELCGEGPSGCAKKVSSELQWCGACPAPETIFS